MNIQRQEGGGERTCVECGAQVSAVGPDCWLCGASLQNEAHITPARPPDAIAPPRVEPISFGLSTLMLIVTLAAICFGLLGRAPGLAVPMCVLLVPVFVRTVMVVRRRQAAGAPVSAWEKVGLFAGSFGVASLLAVVVSVAAFCSFCGVCLLAVSTDKSYGGGETLAFGIGMCTAAAAALVAIVFIIKWIRRRYERDTRRR
ncbi:MAG: hypothetical protein WBF93_08545 [Pirellulales bacterium]